MEKLEERVCECGLLVNILLLQSSTERLHTGTQRGHSFEGLVSMAGVAVVRGALGGPTGGSGNSRRFKTTQRRREGPMGGHRTSRWSMPVPRLREDVVSAPFRLIQRQ